MAAAGVGVAGILVGLREHHRAGRRRLRGPAPAAARRSSSPSRSGPAGLPLPRTDNSVTWAIVDDNPPIADGLPPETGATLRLFNYPDYIYPALLRRFEKRYDCKVEPSATYNSADEAVAKLQSGAVDYDVIMGLSGSNIVNLMALQLLQPLNHSYVPNLVKNMWPELARPVLRPRVALHGALCRLVGRDRLA